MKRTVAAGLAGFLLGSASIAAAGAKVDRLTDIWRNTEQINQRIGNPYVGAPNTISGRLTRIESDMLYQSSKLSKICREVGAIC